MKIIPACSQQIPPSLWITTQVRNGGDQNFIGANLIKQTEWKTMSSATPCSCGQWMSGVRKTQNSFNCGTTLPEKDSSESALFLLVMKRRFRQLRKRSRSKSVLRHLLRDERSSSSADGPSTAASSPLSNASMRSSDSAAHLASISLLRDSSRLSQRRSIRAALSVGWSSLIWS